MIDFPVPLLGFCAYSGTGKTTLLKQLIPILKHEGLRIAVVKHAHHSFDIDHPGKDSYELRQAGADQMLVASRQRMAWVKELHNELQKDPVLEDALAVLEFNDLDLVLVEGFKQAAFPKIELYRASLGKPLMYPLDTNIIAIAADSHIGNSEQVPIQLNLNQPAEIADFILENFLNLPIATSSC
jgi:molybdopterin-guanine dinucleotide biosynthesis protein B